MTVKGLEGMSREQLNFELQRGGKFVVYIYVISILVLTFKRGSPVHFIKAGEDSVRKGLGYTLLSLLAGWWGIPFGPIFTIQAIYTNCKGGKDVTPQMITGMQKAAQAAATKPPVPVARPVAPPAVSVKR